MPAQKILQSGNDDLRKRSKTVLKFDKRIVNLIKNLKDTLIAQSDPEGVGLAAPQIGISCRLFIFTDSKKLKVFINPEITWVSEETNDPPKLSKKQKAKSKDKFKEPKSQKTQEPEQEYIMEGCLSLPHYYGPVKRAKSIKVKYQRPEIVNGQWTMINEEKELADLPAQIVQHEVDHLDGKLFIDHLIEQNRKLYYWNGKDWEEVELP